MIRDFRTWRLCLSRGNEYSDQDGSSLRRLRLTIRNSHRLRPARTTQETPLFLKKGANMNESVSEQPISSSQVVAAYVGIDWADHGARTFIDCTFP